MKKIVNGEKNDNISKKNCFMLIDAILEWGENFIQSRPRCTHRDKVTLLFPIER
jgi:hypothetical protein